MEAHIQSFAEYLHNRKNTSYNTEISYQRDLKKLNEYLKNRGFPARRLCGKRIFRLI